jgi:hypothetical protein
MNVRFFQLGSLVLMGLVLVGCGSKESTPAASIDAKGTGESASGTQATAAKVEPPEAVVTAFLESLRNGNDAVAGALLTDVARVETQKHGLKVQPPGTPDMTYQIGQTEMMEPNGAHVGSVWTNKLEDGSAESFEVIWVLRRETQGWRIAGMATPAMGPDSDPLFFNFEDPADLLQTWENAEGTLAENEAQPNGQPAPTGDGQFVPQESGQFVPQTTGQFAPQDSTQFAPQNNNGQFVPQGTTDFVPQGGPIERSANGDQNPLRR